MIENNSAKLDNLELLPPNTPNFRNRGYHNSRKKNNRKIKINSPQDEKNLLDSGEASTTAVKTVKRGRGITVDRLLDGNALWVSDDGVWRDSASLIRVFDDVILLGRRRMVGGVVGDPDRRLIVLVRFLHHWLSNSSEAIHKFFLEIVNNNLLSLTGTSLE